MEGSGPGSRRASVWHARLWVGEARPELSRQRAAAQACQPRRQGMTRSDALYARAVHDDARAEGGSIGKWFDAATSITSSQLQRQHLMPAVQLRAQDPDALRGTACLSALSGPTYLSAECSLAVDQGEGFSPSYPFLVQ